MIVSENCDDLGLTFNYKGLIMRYSTYLLLLAGICLCGTGCSIFQGKGCSCQNSYDPEAWDCYLADPNVQLDDVWSIDDDGVLICKGMPLGYLYTKREYANFVLKLDWRWPTGKKPGNGGVLIRMTGEHRIWPKSIEAQLNASQAGDFWGLDGYNLSGPTERMKTAKHEQFGKLTNLKKTEDMENPPGEWNSYEIIAEGDTVTLIINGWQVNKATGCDLSPGRICLTSEGDEIHFRNVEITPTN